MRLIRGLYNLNKNTELSKGCVLTIGNFDGVHIGHQHILQRLKQQAKQLNVPSVVMLFEPHPREFFAQKFAKSDQNITASAPARLMRLRDKLHYLKQQQIDFVLCLRFNENFASLQPQDFISQLLVEKLKVKYLSIGDDFRFGQARQGNFETLQQAGKTFNFIVEDSQSHCFEEQRVSSTLIREALHKDNLHLAEQLLGKPYSIRGRVVHGKKLGRTINFPTANIMLDRFVVPIHGVYAVKVNLNGQKLQGIANVGNRPTINGTTALLEVHIFDFNQFIYGKSMEVIFLKKIRSEVKFSSFGNLKKQIQKDVKQVRKIFDSLNLKL
ncbi:bifunctional riboflavin kinase/FAD synthetase [Pasteurella atlantica]|uniref:bifunctional riboflavin kinase/FAD synthetase n=1 Tax=Pasteurellaceae TaxID=712 RepID=UPI00275D303D|nr:bifunctional riboflavin kinase/FAD synthetase [Pasteurella atlantica]MDP8034048.1 bifunctional riboflavin kinase/FAD synthetase [Pasteurella atlantica]MDP8035921.1 bifunctional riboflavin kinase/FAD synthetase [Pasteurella atlantica]MDP8037871.1 bifunctional riboflavin kinase/FAD synthetase [Pasteurella atlantica]MDP8048223.1 bifunctional riboflavin kinase/FAD synthetase [Pasteurella atlantica]MDP8049978.1 bifunctional riboflavin kinase/FAD synthetase [Pasteurella atlantica]